MTFLPLSFTSCNGTNLQALRERHFSNSAVIDIIQNSRSGDSTVDLQVAGVPGSLWIQVWKRKGFTRLTLEGLVSKSKRVELVFPVTVNVGFSFVVATVVALVEAAVIERVIRRVGVKPKQT